MSNDKPKDAEHMTEKELLSQTNSLMYNSEDMDDE